MLNIDFILKRNIFFPWIEFFACENETSSSHDYNSCVAKMRDEREVKSGVFMQLLQFAWSFAYNRQAKCPMMISKLHFENCIITTNILRIKNLHRNSTLYSTEPRIPHFTQPIRITLQCFLLFVWHLVQHLNSND